MHPRGGTWGVSAGTTLAERRSLKRILNEQDVMKDISDADMDSKRRKHYDAWRHTHGWDEQGEYTFYSMRIGGRGASIGWRLDTFIIDERLIDKVAGEFSHKVACDIRYEIYASDHLPVMLELNEEL
ncbi:DNase I-like protein [Wallemia mellicola]|nr:DNase I-like protein [Wallemia mellicola]